MSIEIKNISKTFGKTQALNDVSLTFEQGKIYGLLGDNGAGKTTLFNVISNRIFSSSGEVLIDGEKIDNNDRALSKLFMCGDKNLYPDTMRVKNAFKIAKSFYPAFDMEYAMRLADEFGLKTGKKITSLSTGYQSVFRLICALAVNTPYVLFDEPVLGLDARHRDMFYKKLIEKFAESSATFIVSTHLISEIADVIEQVIIIREGQVLKNSPIEDFLCSGYTLSGPAALVDSYSSGKHILSEHTLGGLKTVSIEGEVPEELPTGLEAGRMNLQDYFIEMMNWEDEKDAH